MHRPIEDRPRKPFRSSPGYVPPDRPEPRPKSLGEAKRLIKRIFDENEWSSSDVSRYQAMLGLKAEPIDQTDLGSAKVILSDLESARMVLFEAADDLRR
ncbi:MAG: hypothetical protein AB7Q37_18930 [Pyrinomonadaceae bacterium]